MSYSTQNSLLLNKLMKFYKESNHLDQILPIINGESKISLRLIDWFATNFSKKNYIVYNIKRKGQIKRFNVYIDYKLKLKAYSKRRFDPFCRWDRITIPYNDEYQIQTTIGQLNFFKWALENNIINFIKENYERIENDMNSRNSTARKKTNNSKQKTRKKREELSVSATKSIKTEHVEIVVKFK